MTSPSCTSDPHIRATAATMGDHIHIMHTAGASPLAISPSSPFLPLETDDDVKASGYGSATRVVSLLSSLTAKDNNARNTAEQAFNRLKGSHPEAFVYGLLEALGSRRLAPHVRGLAAVLLRRALLVEEPIVWDCLQPAADVINGGGVVGAAGAGAGVAGGRRELQACLLQILTDETDASVRRKVGDLVGELGRAVLDEDGPEGWPEFLPYVLLSASGANVAETPDKSNTASNGRSPNEHSPNGNGGGPSTPARQQPQSIDASGSPAGTTQNALLLTPSADSKSTITNHPAWGTVVTGLRLLSAAAEHAANAAAADPSAFRALVETLQRCLCCCEGGADGGTMSPEEGVGSADVRLEAVRALGSVVVSCARPSDQESLATCLPHLLRAIQGTLSSPDRCSVTGAWYCCETLELLIELVEACPSFLRPNVAQCVQGMVQVAGDPLMDTAVRHLALEFLVSIVEAAPAMCRKIGSEDSGMIEARASGSPSAMAAATNGTFAGLVTPVCFAMMTELPENESWALGETEEEDSVEDNVCEVGCEALERVAQALGARAALPECRRLVKEGLGGWNWQQQHAALSAIGYLADVYNQQSGDEGLEIREEAMLQLLPFLSCKLPRVRHAALWSLERMAEDQTPELQEEHSETVLPALLACFQSGKARTIGGCPRVTHRALLALGQMVESCPTEALAPHAEVMLQRCVGLIRQGPLMVQEASVSLLSTAAEALEDDFGRFYDDVVPILKQVLTSCQGTEQRLLRGKTLECVSLVGSTVGKERFGVDALSVMQLMVQAQASGLDDDDPTRVYMLRAWVRICKCLGPDFVPYLPLLMPPLLAAASANVEVELPHGGVDDDGDGVDIDDLDSDVDCMEGLDGEVVAVRTYALEEQATACQMILLLAEALQEHFLPYVEAVAGHLASLVNTSPHDDVRTFCMAAMPELVRTCGKAAVMPGSELEGGRVHQLLEFCLGRLLESLDKEEEVELLMTAAQACKRCVYYACVRWELHTEGMADPAPPTPAACRLVLNDEQSRALARATLGCLGKSLRRRALRRAEATTSEDWDEEEEERAKAAGEEEIELHVNLAELLGFLFKTHGQAFMPAFEEILLPSILEMARPESLPEDRKVAVHVLDHALEFANPAAASLLPTVAPLLLDACRDEDPSVSLPAFFGVGVSAVTYSRAFLPYGVRSFEVLIEAIVRPDAREESREMATDNAVSALGNLLEALRDSLSTPGTGVGGSEGVGKAWEVWLGYMPLGSDEEEAEKVAEQLCRLLTAAPQGDSLALLGSRLERLPLVLTALAEMAGNELVGAEARKAIGQTVMTMQSGSYSSVGGSGVRVPREAFVSAVDGLDEEQRAWLDAAAAECQRI